MAPAVAVYHRFVICAERADRIIEHGIHQRCVRAYSYRPAHYLAIKSVDEVASPQPQALHDWGTHPTDKGIAFFLQPAQIDFHLCDMA